MKILIVKISSLGDVLHTLPALTDAVQALPGVRFDWVVEEVFAEIPAWHPAVDTVIPVALRRWRKQPLRALRSGEWGKFRDLLRAHEYDKIIDAQGLIKSALLTFMGRGKRTGLSRSSAREPCSALFYQERHNIPKQQHAIERVRQLFAAALGYKVPNIALDYGIRRARFPGFKRADKYIVFLHGTSWPSKEWPEPYWITLSQMANSAGFTVLLPWGNTPELSRVQRIAEACRQAKVLPKMNLQAIASVLCNASGAVGVDTGLAHLAAALSVPSVTLYGATRPGLTGTLGNNQRHLCVDFICAPCIKRTCTYPKPSEVNPACYQTLPPARVWQEMVDLLGGTSSQDNKWQL